MSYNVELCLSQVNRRSSYLPNKKGGICAKPTTDQTPWINAMQEILSAGGRRKRRVSKHQAARSKVEGREDANGAKKLKANRTTITPRVYQRRGLFATDVTESVLAEGAIAADRMNTYKGQFRNDNSQGGQEVDGEICQVVVGVVGADEEEHNGHTEQELLGRCVLVSVVDLLPHVEVIVGTGIELEWDAPHPVKHKEGAEHIADVGQSPRGLLGDTGDNVVEDLEGGNEDEVDGPGTCSRDNIPVSSDLFVGSCRHDDQIGRGWVFGKTWRISHSPLALTQFALRLGKAAWSLVCSMDSGGSW